MTGRLNSETTSVEICDVCGAPANPRGSYWFAANDLWNEVNGSPNGFMCPDCFTAACEAEGIAIGWRADRVGDIEQSVLLREVVEALEACDEQVSGPTDTSEVYVPFGYEAADYLKRKFGGG